MKLILESWRNYLIESGKETKLIRYIIIDGDGRGLFQYANAAAKRIGDKTKTDLPSPYIIPPSSAYKTEFWFTESGLEKYREFLDTIVQIAEEEEKETQRHEMILPLDGIIPDYDIPKHKRATLSQAGMNFSSDSKVPGVGFLAYKDQWQVAFYRRTKS